MLISHHFPFEVSLLRKFKDQGWKEKMDKPMTLCISFPLRGQGPDSASCCSPLWPPEGRVQVNHSGGADSSAHLRCAVEQE